MKLPESVLRRRHGAVVYKIPQDFLPVSVMVRRKEKCYFFKVITAVL